MEFTVVFFLQTLLFNLFLAFKFTTYQVTSTHATYVIPGAAYAGDPHNVPSGASIDCGKIKYMHATFILCSIYGTAHGQVYNHTRVLAWDPNKTRDFCSSTLAMHA